MKNIKLTEWMKKAGARAGRTVAQAVIAGIGTAAVMGQVDWKYVISSALLAGVVSVLTSIAVGMPEIETVKDSGGE
ncbi:MAG: holin [Muricomes sp.]